MTALILPSFIRVEQAPLLDWPDPCALAPIKGRVYGAAQTGMGTNPSGVDLRSKSGGDNTDYSRPK